MSRMMASSTAVGKRVHKRTARKDAPRMSAHTEEALKATVDEMVMLTSLVKGMVKGVVQVEDMMFVQMVTEGLSKRVGRSACAWATREARGTACSRRGR